VGYNHIGPERKLEALQALKRSGRPDYPNALRNRYNYHLFFWFHGATFLAPRGRLVFITSGEWLDSDYGAQLQEWLLRNTHVEIAVESLAEAWFTEARVGTVVLSARTLESGEATSDKKTRFALLRRPLRDLFGCWPGESDAEHISHVDIFRDRLLHLEDRTGETTDFDWSVVDQDELSRLGQRT
jgi:hypothetical protein